ncbi:vacuolar sorting-associated 9A-like [Micractinium conductrix]|uniref:Vacuolar sorting-associated 9A-like n=1 Tax=Micractinium conductrix TaxID=554055 RepID=A0A2P6VF35_9CHLO|nr:vacuolar sorting-associated 9A-like [Micractinium conductrix]|eukprot:PSC72702.1 vacuolar sorting-associated 9A-like [Micractinium conductrix]
MGEPASAPSGGRTVGLTFGDFLAKMKDPQAADLVRNIKSFIRQFEERPAGQAVDPESDSARVQAFLAASEAAFRQHPVWHGCQPEVLDQAVEGLEKYVMSKIWRQTFGAWPEDRERDERYQRLMQALGFVDLPTLMGVDVTPDESLLGLAQAEVLKMDRYKAPRDKLLCLVNVKTMVENIVQLAARAGASIGGADAFFPVFLFAVLRSRLPRLASNVEYVKRFRCRPRLNGQFDYMLCNLESSAMWLDTVNYEHLAVSQVTFLGHLAAAGIPEAHMELRRMQQEAEEAAAAAAQAAGAAASSADDAASPRRAAASVARAAAEGAAAAAARHDAAAAAADDADDVLAGLELAGGDGDGAATVRDSSEGEAGLGSVQPSMPATPTDAAAAAMFAGADGSAGGGSGGREGRPSLTPLDDAQSPTVLAPAGSAAPAAGLGSAGVSLELPHTSPPPAQQQGGRLQRGLSFESAAELATAGEQQEQQQQQQAARQCAEEAAWAQREAAGAVAAAQAYSEPPLIEEMVAEGTRLVLAAEAAGQLQQRYPFMYAQAEDLSLTEVQAVLVGYKELLLRYEALSRSLQQQLGLGDAAAAAEGPSAAGPAGTDAPRGHRPKQLQQEGGFGSLVLPDQLEAAFLGGAAGARRASAPVPLASGSPDASPSGKWSPGGILQRIAPAARGLGRSFTPPRERGSRTAGEQSPAAAAARPGKQAPFFATLFGGSKPAAQQELGASAGSPQPAALAPKAAAVVQPPAAAPQQPAQQQQQQQQPAPQQALPSSSEEPERSFAAVEVAQAGSSADSAAAAGSTFGGSLLDAPLTEQAPPEPAWLEQQQQEQQHVDQMTALSPPSQQQQQQQQQQAGRAPGSMREPAGGAAAGSSPNLIVLSSADAEAPVAAAAAPPMTADNAAGSSGGESSGGDAAAPSLL